MDREQALENFRKLKERVDVAPFLDELEAHPAWARRSGRQKMIPVQRETQSMFLRAPTVDLLPQPLRKLLGIKVHDSHGSFWARESKKLPALKGFLQEFAASQGTRLGRANVVRLKPQGKVYPHIDQGAYSRRRDRYHLVLKSEAGSVLTAGGETVVMRAGELWWFDNKKEHSAENPSDEWRIHLIFDLDRRRR
ncbi:MAG: aspartyl/asparaginyl beta-hydroxylase domain-containing protein [Pseudomonadota bacterium]